MKIAIIITFSILAVTSGICLFLEDAFKVKLPISRINVFKLMVLSIFLIGFAIRS